MSTIVSLEDAVATLVQDGYSVTLEGFTQLNLSATVIGDYGAGSSTRTFVGEDFCTTVGHGDGTGTRARLGLRGSGPTAVTTDLGVMEPDRDTGELLLSAVHEGVELRRVWESTGWDVKLAGDLRVTEPPSDAELASLRELEAR